VLVLARACTVPMLPNARSVSLVPMGRERCVQTEVQPGQELEPDHPHREGRDRAATSDGVAGGTMDRHEQLHPTR
jgi:hypothetical protein